MKNSNNPGGLFPILILVFIISFLIGTIKDANIDGDESFTGVSVIIFVVIIYGFIKYKTYKNKSVEAFDEHGKKINAEIID